VGIIDSALRAAKQDSALSPAKVPRLPHRRATRYFEKKKLEDAQVALLPSHSSVIHVT
jgi:hypothetical protein